MPSRGALLNYSTVVEAARSIEQIQKRLVAHNASAILLDYAHGEVTAITFRIATVHGELAFRLPVNLEAVESVLRKQHYEGRIQRMLTSSQVRRIAWRILKDWTEAQLALVQIGMATIHQVFLPYNTDSQGKTLYQHLEEGGFKQLAIGKKEESDHA